MNSIDQVVSTQLGIINQFTGALTHKIFSAATLFMEKYYEYFYTRLMRGISAE